MQLYLAGTSPLFWRQITAQPTGIYNRQNNQSSSALINHILVAFVDRAIGTVLNVVVNGTKYAEMKVIDTTGFAYARITVPYTRNQDSITIELRDNDGVIVESEYFATSNIGFFYEVQSSVSQPTWEDAQQIQEDPSIVGVDTNLLENKYGIYTGLRRRNDQTASEYRDQTGCIWQAFQYAGTEKGLVDAIGCLLGKVGLGVEIEIIPVRSVAGNRIFDYPQFGPRWDEWDYLTPISLARNDDDWPHSYVAYKVADYRTGYSISDPSPTQVLGPYPNDAADNYDSNTVKSFTVYTSLAAANENIMEMSHTTQLEVPEDIASVTIAEEQILRGTTSIDKMVNEYISTAVVVTEATLSGVPEIVPDNLPQEGTDFTVDPIRGEITWTGPITPDTGTIYKIMYSFRLDVFLAIIIRQVKPAYQRVVVTFNNVKSGLPLSVVA